MMLFHFRSLILPIKQINKALPLEGIVYEIGSGHGSLAYEIARYSSDRKVIGLDLNKEKIEKAQDLFVAKNLQFVKEDALTFSYKKCEGLILSDFLHHITFEMQEKIIKKISSVLNQDGVLIIKEIDQADVLRMYLSRLWDFVLYPQEKIYYRTKKAWQKLLGANGFEVSVRREVPWFPGSTYLFICRKTK